MRLHRLLLSLAIVLIADASRAETRISGTYVTHGADFADMLQLTQTEGGRITGVLSEVTLKPDGKITSEQGPVSGAIDGGQITLSFSFGLLSGGSIAGTVGGNAIQLSAVGKNGNVVAWTYARGTPAEFQTYANQFQARSQAIVLSARVEKVAKTMEQTVRDAKAWGTDAEVHLQRIPSVKEYYQKISAKMETLLQRKRMAPNAVMRSQIGVAITQGSVAGTQVDVQANAVWDRIEERGAALSRSFASYPPSCVTSEELAARGASQAAIARWQSACPAAVAERIKFREALKRVTEARADLKAFQQGEEQRRKELERQSSQIE